MLVCPACSIPLEGLIVMVLKLLLADQGKLTVVELLLSETEHSQFPPVGPSKHCLLAKIVRGWTDNVGAAITLSVM